MSNPETTKPDRSSSDSDNKQAEKAARKGKRPPKGRPAVEMSRESLAPAHRISRDQLQEIQAKAQELERMIDKFPEGDLVARVINTSLKLLRDETNRGDVKLIERSLAELRYALKIFGPYRDVRKISVFGSARTGPDQPDYQAAVEYGRIMAQRGWMVTTGAGGGIMAAAHGGAGPEPSFGLAIRLPFEQETNEHIAKDPKLINFKYFFTRKLMFLRTSHAIALFPGGFGTMDEGFEVLTLVQTGKSVPVPLVMIDKPGGKFWENWDGFVRSDLLGRGLISEADLKLYKVTNDLKEAADEVTKFYSNYHSIRYVADTLSIRMLRAPTAKQLDEINGRFKHLLLDGDIRCGESLKQERDELEIRHLPRLILHFNRRDHGGLRELIDYINEF